jgi:MarR family
MAGALVKGARQEGRIRRRLLGLVAACPAVVRGMGAPRGTASVIYLEAQRRILDVLASGAPFGGTVDELADRLGLTAYELRVCLRGLVRGGWVTVQTLPGSRLTARPEHRTRGSQRVAIERRQPAPDAWPL